MIYEYTYLLYFIIYIYIETRIPSLIPNQNHTTIDAAYLVPSSKVAFALCGAREVGLSMGFSYWMDEFL